MAGSWSVQSMERDGMQAPDFILIDLMLVAGDGKYTFKQGDNVVEEGTYKLAAPGKGFQALDFSITKGEDKGKAQVGIVELDGDKLKICLAKPGSKARPTRFATKAGSDSALTICVRSKK